MLIRAGVPDGRARPRVGPRRRDRQRARRASDGVDAISFTGSVETGPRHRRGRARARRARAARDGRQEPARRARRRRPRDRRRLRAAGRLLLDRPALHRLEPADRRPRASTTASSTRLIERLAERQGRPRARRRDRDRPGRRRAPARPGSRLPRDRRASEGAELAFGGGGSSARTRGPLPEPALFVGATNDMRIAARRSSARSPRVIRVADYDEALAVANDTRVRPLQRHLHDEPAARVALQASRRRRHGDGQPADRGRRLPRPASAGARARRYGPREQGALRARVLHPGQDRVRQPRTA